MQQSCFTATSTGYVVIVNEILVCEYMTECNVAPLGVRKLSKQAVDLTYVLFFAPITYAITVNSVNSVQKPHKFTHLN